MLGEACIKPGQSAKHSGFSVEASSLSLSLGQICGLQFYASIQTIFIFKKDRILEDILFMIPKKSIMNHQCKKKITSGTMASSLSCFAICDHNHPVVNSGNIYGYFCVPGTGGDTADITVKKKTRCLFFKRDLFI